MGTCSKEKQGQEENMNLFTEEKGREEGLYKLRMRLHVVHVWVGHCDSHHDEDGDKHAAKDWVGSSGSRL